MSAPQTLGSGYRSEFIPLGGQSTVAGSRVCGVAASTNQDLSPAVDSEIIESRLEIGVLTPFLRPLPPPKDIWITC